MRMTVTLTPEDVKRAVDEWLARQGYQVESVRFEVTTGYPDGPGGIGQDAGLQAAVAEVKARTDG